ncbi:hypothetical protein [Oceanobacillus sp. J11TS1]|uniref:hypothetical protein n=1 Tax=Oceanobacillus sp. J11TS1 TaxID=2807191 RepID=UPI001B02EDFF|nr:hypothetical protein [Oceanobacillus sp. J11TS1]GIO22462.1 hypothetical protein J11TS1_10430 [Oceanobacillus sp. J11TS1]
MQKIKLTQGQVDTIEGIKNKMDGWIVQEHKRLNGLALEDFSKCLLVPDSYEVIPQFKLGEWVVNLNTGEIGQVEAFKNVNGALGNSERIVVNSIINYPDSLRHATPEEIQQEKKRRFWDKLGRDVDEYKTGDIVFNESTKQIYRVARNGLIPAKIVSFKLICPVEQRLDK